MIIKKYTDFVLEAKKQNKKTDWKTELLKDISAEDENYKDLYTPEQIYNKYRDMPGVDNDEWIEQWIEHAIELNSPNHIEYIRTDAGGIVFTDSTWFSLLRKSYMNYGYRGMDCTHEIILTMGVNLAIKLSCTMDDLWNIVEYCIDEFPDIYDKRFSDCILSALGFYDEYNWFGATIVPATKNLKNLIELNTLLDDDTLKTIYKFDTNQTVNYTKEDVCELLFKTIDENVEEDNLMDFLSDCSSEWLEKTMPIWFKDKYEYLFEFQHYTKTLTK